MEKSVKIQRCCTIAGLVICAGAFIAAYAVFGKELLAFVSDTERFRAWLDGYKGAGAVIFVAIRAVQTVVKIIPAEPLEIAAGYVYGTFGGLALCMAGTLLGSVVILLIARKLGTKAVELFVPHSKLESLHFLNDEGSAMRLLFMVYLIPSTPKDVITWLVGCTKINPLVFMAVTSLARIPSIVTSTYCGAKLGEQNYTAAVLMFAVTAVVGVAGSLIYGKISKNRRLTGGNEAHAEAA